MGGFGAFILALNKPDHFWTGIVISGVLDIVTARINLIYPVFDVYECFGVLQKLEGSPNDLFAQIQSLRRRGKSIPKLYMICRLNDLLHEMNVKSRNHANLNIISLSYEEDPGGLSSDSWISISARL